MWSKIANISHKDKIIFILTLVAIIIFIATFVRALWYIPSDEIELSEMARAKLAGEKMSSINKSDASAFPTQFEIPELNIVAKIQEVGVTRKGNMAAPNNFADVGWFKYGILPGEVGSAVFAGHVDNGFTLPGVFYHLSDLEIGDDVFVVTKGGEKLHFKVNKIEIFDFDDRDTNVFTDKNGKLIKIITCSGTWVSQNKTHSERLVITAELSEN